MTIEMNILKKYRDFTLDCQLEAGNEIIGLLGSSGSGKSLTLKSVAGIIMPDRGRIVIDDRVVFDSEKKIRIPARERKVGYLFQNYALFPRMTVAENITACLSGSRQEKNRKAEELLKKFQLEGFGDKKPDRLSGGQQQRAAMARMMSIEPKTILLDEPFSALDTNLKWRLENDLAVFLRSFSGTTVLVTHNKDEAYRLCDRIAVIDDGKIREFGEKEEIFRNPKTRSAAAMLGFKNIAPLEEGTTEMEVPRWKLTLPKDLFSDGEDIYLEEEEFSLEKLPEALEISGRLINIIRDRDRDIFILEVTDEEEGRMTLEFPHREPYRSDPVVEEFLKNRGKIIRVYYPRNKIRKLVDPA